MLFVDGFASNDKMQRFKHHTEQQVYHTSKDLQQSPYTGKDSQQVGIVFILDGKTEYTNCMIQTVNDPSLSQKNITDSMISSFPSMHPPRICCHLFPTSVFCVLSSGESGIGPVSVFDKDLGRFDGEEVQDVWKRPQITSPLSSVHRGGDDHHESHKQRKKRRGFGISLFGKKNRRSVPVETDSSSSTSSSETESPPPKPPSTPLPPPMPVTPVRLNEKDLRSLRDACERQSREIESLRQVVVFLRRELKQSPLRHRRNVAALARLRKESFQSVENM